MNRFAIALIAAAAAAPVSAQVYKCKDAGGTTVYSAQPCGAGAQAVDARPAMVPSTPSYYSYGSTQQGWSGKSNVTVRDEAKIVWVCPDGAISDRTCDGGRPKKLDDLNAAELNAYTKARIAAEARAKAESKARATREKAEAAEQERKKSAACEAAFAGKPPVTNSGFDGSVLGVERYLKQVLKDPDSYKSVEWSPVVKGCGSYLVRHKYRAKNSFGGYVLNQQLFTLNPDGVVTDASELR